MGFSTLNEWLEFQQGINPKEIDLSLDRVQTLYNKLQINIPEKNVFLIGGTNGKGTTTSILEQLFRKKGYKTGAFTSPHLTQYNERVRINLNNSFDQDLVSAFEIIEAVRGDVSLTYFELLKLEKDYEAIGYSVDEINIQKHKFYSLPILLTVMTIMASIIMFYNKFKKNRV